MKLSNRILITTFLLLVFSPVGGQSIIENKKNLDIPHQLGQFEHAILTPTKFQMNQGFTLMTSMNSGMSQTKGIYSNFSSYKLSERLQFYTGIHLIQSQNNLSYSSGHQTGVDYQIGLEYKLGPNSMISLQVANYNNSPISYKNLSPFNVP